MDEEQQIPQTPQEIPQGEPMPEVEPPKDNKNLIISILAVLLVVVIAFGAYLLFFNNNGDVSPAEEKSEAFGTSRDAVEDEIDSDKIVYESAKCGISFEHDSSWEVREIPGSAADNTMVVIPRPEPITSSGIVSLNLPHSDLSINELISKHESLRCNGCEFRNPIESNINGIKVIEHFAYDIYNKIDMRPGRFYFEQNGQVCSLNDEAAPEELIEILNSIKSI